MEFKNVKNIFCSKLHELSKGKRVFHFIVSSCKYEPYEIDSFQKLEVFKKTNFSLSVGNRNFRSALMIYRDKISTSYWTVFREFRNSLGNKKQ
jgi:hypothetical protein